MLPPCLAPPGEPVEAILMRSYCASALSGTPWEAGQLPILLSGVLSIIVIIAGEDHVFLVVVL